MYYTVPDGRIGVRLTAEKKDKNFTLSEFELTREDLQVSSLIYYIFIIKIVHGGNRERQKDR